MAKQEKARRQRRTQGSERKSERPPQPTAEVVFLSCGTLTVMPGGTMKWEPLPTPGVSAQLLGGTTYSWCGEGAWKAASEG